MTAQKTAHPLAMLRQLSKRVLPPGKPAAREFTIDELARESDTTLRYVRAYQDLGLLLSFY